MALRYTLAKKVLPIMLKKATDKNPALFFVLSVDMPDHFCLNNTGTFDADTASPLLNEDKTEPAFLTTHPEQAEAIQKELTLQGAKYHYVTLVTKGFLTGNMERVIAETIIGTEYDIRRVEMPDNLDAVELMRQMTIANTTTSVHKLSLPEAAEVDNFLDSLVNADDSTVEVEATPV